MTLSYRFGLREHLILVCAISVRPAQSGDSADSIARTPRR